MKTHSRIALAGLILSITACSESNNALAPQYQPEVVNTANVAFSFQATGLQDITDNLSYTWSASSGRVIIHPATATLSGTITLNLRDAAGTVIYNGTVPSSGDITPPTGVGGPWTIRVMLSDYSGTVNFAVQMQ